MTVAQAGTLGVFGLLFGLVTALAAWFAGRRSAGDGTGPALLRLHQRNQALLHRQLTVLDGLERREDDAGDLAELFRADHLAAQARRNAERAILLAGHEPGRRWRDPVPLVDVARAAAASVERQAAVHVGPLDGARLAGPAVGAVLHLLTELIENATQAAPGDDTVWVTGERGPSSYGVLVRDRGTGLTPAELTAARAALTHPARRAGPSGFGLRLAGRLARAHDIGIDLEESSRGGVVARVRIPLTLILPSEDAPQPSSEPYSGTTAESTADVPSEQPGDHAGAPAGAPDPAPPDGGGDLPVRQPRPVPSAAAGLVRRGRDGAGRNGGRDGAGTDGAGRAPVDRTARFRERLAGREAAAATTEPPEQRSTVDEEPQA